MEEQRGKMFRQVYAVVTEKEFNTFRSKCYENDINIGDCLAKLIRDYIKANSAINKIQYRKKPDGVDYGKEHP